MLVYMGKLRTRLLEALLTREDWHEDSRSSVRERQVADCCWSSGLYQLSGAGRMQCKNGLRATAVCVDLYTLWFPLSDAIRHSYGLPVLLASVISRRFAAPHVKTDTETCSNHIIASLLRLILSTS